MNCRRVREIMPLYVEGDLGTDRMRLVTAHLRSCDECSDLADGYCESQTWLRTYSPPAFDSAFFDHLKQGVFAQINASAARPSFFQLFDVRRRFVAAFAALLLLIGVYGLYRYQGSSSGHTFEQIVISTTEAVLPSREHDHEVEPSVAPKERPHRRATRPAAIVARLTELAQPEWNEVLLAESVVGTLPGSEALADFAVEATLELGSDPPGIWDSEFGADQQSRIADPLDEVGAHSATLRSTTRIELQTSDPRIRIIWFVPNDVDNSKKPSADS